MKKLPREIFSFVSNVQRVQFLNSYLFITSKEGDYVYLDHSSNPEIYSLFQKESFEYYYPLLNSKDDSYQIFLLDSYSCLTSLEILSDLYKKTSKEVLWDEMQTSRIYNRLQKDLHGMRQYYLGLQNRIEEMYYPRESFYHLLLSISSFYHLISLGEFFLSRWFSMEKMSYLEVLTIRCLNSLNFKGGKVIDCSYARRDYYLYELANYYREHFMEESILEEIVSFLDDFSSSKEDLFLFYSLISVSWEVSGEDLVEVSQLINYVSKTYSFLLEKYEEYQAEEKSMEEKEKKNV